MPHSHNELPNGYTRVPDSVYTGTKTISKGPYTGSDIFARDRHVFHKNQEKIT